MRTGRARGKDGKEKVWKKVMRNMEDRKNVLLRQNVNSLTSSFSELATLMRLALSSVVDD